MGQDDEQHAELLSTIRLSHPQMKAWYHGPSLAAASVRQLHGEKYPTFWRDVLEWDDGQGWRDARRAYLKWSEGGGREEEEREERLQKEKVQKGKMEQAKAKNDGAAENDGNGATDELYGDCEAPAAKKADGEAADAGAAATAEETDASKPRKRRSRWASSAEPPTDAELNGTSTNGNTNSPEGQPPTKRKSRWARESSIQNPTADPTSVPNADSAVALALGAGRSAATAAATTSDALAAALPGLVGPTNLTPEQQVELTTLQAQLRKCNARLSNLEGEAARIDALPQGHPDRSPSPPPVYDAFGKRKNTRAVRWRDRYTTERQDTLEKMMDLNPAMRPAGWVRRRRNKKIPIPIEEHPNYNFIGLIIGPRGKTQKELEAKTSCKIAIRGKGSVKEGAKGRNGKILEGDDEPLHVLIQGDDPAKVEEAGKLIEEMLVVIDDEQNVHKQAQLRELALLNGTLKEDEFCPICAEKGHRAFECPKRFSAAGGARSGVTVKCAICGDTSHPTRDCVQNKAGGAAAVGGGAVSGADGAKKAEEADADYLNFMAELDGKPRADDGGGDESASPSKASAGATSVAGAGSSLPICQPVGSCSAVTTISSTIEGRMKEAPPPPKPAAIPEPSPGSFLTVISSTVKTVESVPAAPATNVGAEGSTSAEASSSSLKPEDTSGAAAAPVPLPPPPSGPPPAPPAVPKPTDAPAPAPAPVASGAAPVPAAAASLPLPPPPSGPPPPIPPGLPPAPTQMPPPAPATAKLPPMPPPPGPASGWQQQQRPPPPQQQYRGGYNPQQQQQQPYGWQQQQQQQRQQYGYQGQQPHGQYGGGYGQQPPYGQFPPQQQQPYGGNPGNGMQQQGGGGGGAGWDYRSYFGNAPTGGDKQGAGGFDWWDQQE